MVFLSKLNEKSTKKRIKEEQALKEADNKNKQNVQPVQQFSQPKINTSGVFAEMSKYTP